MVDKCANPTCSATFHRLGEGRLFIKEIDAGAGDGRARSREIRYCWLCDSCRRTMTVITERGKEVKVAPLPPSAPAARAAW